METDTIDQIIRSRPTIVEILKDRGYDVSAYEHVNPEDILTLATTSSQLLKIVATNPDNAKDRIIVLYWVESSYRLRVEPETNNLWKEENPDHYNPETDTIIILLAEPFHPVFDIQAAKQWTLHKHRVSFFNMKNLISNPLKHVMQPEFRKLTEQEAQDLQLNLKLKSRKNLPMIIYHVDMVARVMGLLPGEILHIQRPSETSGLTEGYRVCVL